MKSLLALKAQLRALGYRVYERPYELNIVGVRTPSVASNRFDDELWVFYRNPALLRGWSLHRYAVTTDPGTYWLAHPQHPMGTALLQAGQYIGAYAIGRHKGLYEALVQVRPVTVLRQYRRGAWLDWHNGIPHRGLFGINLHRARAQGTTPLVNEWSAGCTVFASAGDYAEFMALCRGHATRYGNTFTYTLLDQRAVQRRRRARAAAFTCAGAAMGLAGYWYHLQNMES